MKKFFTRKILPILLTLTMIFCLTTMIGISASAATAQTYQVKVNTYLNIRSGPSTGYKIVGSYKNNTKITVTQEKNGWCKTSKGWVSKNYLSKVKTTTATTTTNKNTATTSTTVKGKTYKKTVSNVKVTAYCACQSCNGYWSNGYSSKTASGFTLKNESNYANKYCAATPSVGNLGDTVTFKAKGKTYTVKIVDRLGSSYGNRIDLFVPNHSNCYKFGVQYGTPVKVYR